MSIKNGFTIIEVLVGVFVLALMAAAVGVFQQNVYSLNGVFQSNLVAQREARQALDRMTAEIRPLALSSVGAYPISEASTTSFIFYSDIDGDGLMERMRYFLSGATLKKGTLKPTGSPPTYNPANEVIKDTAHNIANGAVPIFEYYDTNYNGAGAALAQPVNVLSVRLVKITIMIDDNPSKPPSPLTVTTQISMRNLKDNL